MARVLGIDPGSRTTGYGLVDVDGSKLKYVACGCITPQAETLGHRLGAIYAELAELISEFKPHEFAIEQVFMHRNAQSALKLGQARGAAIVAAANRDLPIYEYSATQIKKATTGRGHAGKNQVQHMMQALLRLQSEPRSDAADALAVAVAHGHHRNTTLVMQANHAFSPVGGPNSRSRRRRRTP